MLSTKYVEEYMLLKKGNNIEIDFNTEGHRRLNPDVKLPIDLTLGYDSSFDNTVEEHRSLEVFLQWMVKKSPEGDLGKVTDGAKFVSRKGILSRMAQGRQLLHKGNWNIVAENRKGVIFLEEEITEEKKERNRAMSDQEKRAVYAGHKFEEYMILPHTQKTQPDEEGVDLVEKMERTSLTDRTDLRVVLKSTLQDATGGFQLLYSGEIDAIDKDGTYIELKTQKEKLGGYWFWKEKTLRWWLQSKLMGINALVVGIKDTAGSITELKSITLADLNSRQWNGDACLAFLLEALHFIVDNVQEDTCVKIACINGELKAEPRAEGGFLSEEFKTHFGL